MTEPKLLIKYWGDLNKAFGGDGVPTAEKLEEARDEIVTTLTKEIDERIKIAFRINKMIDLMIDELNKRDGPAA